MDAGFFHRLCVKRLKGPEKKGCLGGAIRAAMVVSPKMWAFYGLFGEKVWKRMAQHMGV